MQVVMQRNDRLCVIAAAALFAGCGESQPPIGTPGAVPQSHALAPHMQRGGSWMMPGAKRKNLLYVSSYGYNGQFVYVYAYPAGTLEGTLTGFDGPQGECVDKAGNVFITNYFGHYEGNYVVEYAHGGTKPIATLWDQPYSWPDDCSYDSVTGDLAVSDAFVTSGNANVAIYKNARGKPTFYSDPNLFDLFGCAYDGSGNLFVVGDDQHLRFALAELPKGSSTFTEIKPPKVRKRYGLAAIAWDGKHIALGNVDDNKVYQLHISGAKAKVVGSTPLTDGNHVDFFSITKLAGGTVNSRPTVLVGADYAGANVKIWEYPAGGLSVKTIGFVYAPVGIAVSPAKK